MIARAALIATIAIAAGLGCGGHAPAARGPVVDLSLPALDGGTIELGAHRGHVVVVHLFATWSLDAQSDVEQLEAVATRKTAVVIGVALDLDGFPILAPWRKASGVTYLIALADEAVRGGGSVLGRVDTVPTTIVLDRAGRTTARVSRRLADGELDRLIARADAH